MLAQPILAGAQVVCSVIPAAQAHTVLGMKALHVLLAAGHSGCDTSRGIYTAD
jgi:hypothetical protein